MNLKERLAALVFELEQLAVIIIRVHDRTDTDEGGAVELEQRYLSEKKQA